MDKLPEVIKAIGGSDVHVIFIVSGFLLVILGTTRFKRLQIVPKYRKLLNGVAIASLAIGLGLLFLGGK